MVYDNIPILSYVFLRDAAVAAKTIMAVPHCRGFDCCFGRPFTSLACRAKLSFAFIFSAIIVLIFIDLNHRILPDVAVRYCHWHTFQPDQSS